MKFKGTTRTGGFSSLSYEQKESLGLLQIGTFLEYFDLMLYIHMAVLLNELFFPPSDPHTASILAAITFCSTYIMRPLGALIFGWMGDNIGRRSTIIITTILMSISCIIMANLPTYAQIGISAAWIVTFCRMAQGMSSMGEIMGAEIYIAESIPRPVSYPAVALIPIASAIGAMVALGVSSLVASFFFNWRVAFWIGAGIALVGAVARTRLRETPEFLEMKRKQLKEALAEANKYLSEEERQPPKLSWKERIRFHTLVSYFLVQCGWSLSFYLAYLYFNPMLKEKFGYSSTDIINHNFFLSIFMLFSYILGAFLSCRVHPIKILKIRGILTLLLMLLLPFLIVNVYSPMCLFFIQSLILLLPLNASPADAVLIYYLPISHRFTSATFSYALARALMYILTSFGLVYLGSHYGDFGIWLITLPITIVYLYGVFYFEALERKAGYLSFKLLNKPFLARLFS